MNHTIAVILLAGGRGSRFGGEIPKQYCTVAGKPLICHTLQALAAEPRIGLVQPVIAADDCWFADCVAGRDDPFTLLPPVRGGAERALSMQAGLAALPGSVTMVAIHDAARATPSAAVLQAVFDAAQQHGAAIPGIAVHDTIKRVDEWGRVVETLPRASLMAVQTPQVMRRDWLEQAMAQESHRLASHTDDASLLEAAGFDVYISEGHRNNRKITTPADLAWLGDYLEALSCV